LCSISSIGTPGIVSKLPCKDVPIFLEEFDEREFYLGSRLFPI
jgi:hypothetical protein